MKPGHRTSCPEVIAIKVPAALAAEIRRQARHDDRTVSGYLRRLLAATLQQHSEEEADATAVPGR